MVSRSSITLSIVSWWFLTEIQTINPDGIFSNPLQNVKMSCYETEIVFCSPSSVLTLPPRPVSLACLISKLTNLFLKWKLNLLMARHRFRPNEIPDSLIILPRAKKHIALFASQLNIETRLGSSNREINISKEHENPTKFSFFHYLIKWRTVERMEGETDRQLL